MEHLEGTSLPCRSFPSCRKDAQQQIGCEEFSHIELGSEDQPLYQYTVNYISKLLSEDGTPSFSSAKVPKQRARLDDIGEIGGIVIMGKGMGKGRSRKRKADDRNRLPKTPNIGLGWHCFEWCPPAANDEDEQLAAAVAADGAVKAGEEQQTSSVSSSGNGATPATASGDGKDAQAPVTVWALLQTLGAPVKSDMGSCLMYSTLVLFVRGAGRTDILWQLIRQASRAATKVQHNIVSIWRYDMKHNYWQQLARRQPRVLKSVIMDKNQKGRLVEDLTWFLKDDTADFYAKHGIPYHRSYLFYGPPGAGKTSCIFALAGHFKRNICFIQFNKGTTDDTFRLAVSDAPAESILVMEDVDALFTVHRETSESSSLSFSGFLNALDGLGAPEDVIFILTTNHPERLDPAVRRPGRVDLHVQFSTPSKDMAAEYFSVFYPGEATHAKEFAAATGERLRGGDLSMAQLQHYFLDCHRRALDAKGAVDLVGSYSFESGRHGTTTSNTMFS